MDSSAQLREGTSGFVTGDAIRKVGLENKLNKKATLKNDDNNNVVKLPLYRRDDNISYKRESYASTFDSFQLMQSDPTKKRKNLDHRNITPENVLKFATSIVQHRYRAEELAGKKVDNRGTRTVKREIKRRACRLSSKISKLLAVKEELHRVNDRYFSLALRKYMARPSHFRKNVNVKDKNGKNALHLLCKNIHSTELIAVIEFLIEIGIDVNATDKYGQNALHYLCRYNRNPNLVEAIQILHVGYPIFYRVIESGVDVNAKDNDGRNALYILVALKAEKYSTSFAFRYLIRRGVQVPEEYIAKSNVYQTFFNDKDYRKECFDFLARKKIRLGWHNDCENCKEILSMTRRSRMRLQHHQKFGNCYQVFQLVMIHLEKWAEGNRPSGKSQMRPNPTKWLREKAKQYHEDETSYEEHFEIMADVSEQVKNGSNSSQFDCDKYELYLRSMYSIAEMIDCKQSMGQIKWWFLLPFDFPIDYDGEKDSDTKQAKAEWDKTLFRWAHTETNKDYGKSLKEIANEGFFLSGEFKHKCHGGL